jgi:transposase
MGQQKRLNDIERRQVEKMIEKALSPEDIANHFGIAISTVHHIKKEMKTKGITLPNVRGKRPQGFISPKDIPVINNIELQDTEVTRLIVNNIQILLTQDVKSVNVTKEGVYIRI